jgi:hypothetical protein
LKKVRPVLDRAASRADELLSKSPNPQADMAWAEGRLEEAGLLEGNPSRKNPFSWSQDALAENPALLEQSPGYLQERGTQPEKAPTFENLILSLIPTEGGL